MRGHIGRLVLAVLPLALLASCSEVSTPTEEGAPDEAFDLDLTSDLESLAHGLGLDVGDPPPLVDVLRRDEPLDEDVVDTVQVGSSGGPFEFEEMGLVLDFPEGALEERTEITVTAPEGDLVGFDFEPAGLRFEEEVTLSVDLDIVSLEETEELLDLDLSLDLGLLGDDPETVAELLEHDGSLAPEIEAGLLGVYFLGELRPRLPAFSPQAVSIEDDRMVFTVDHFSGWVCASN